MARYLVVVESPGKIKKLTAILGRDYRVVASMGHVVDLPRKQFGIDLDTMAPDYTVVKPDVAKRLRAEAKKPYQVIYLAADPDREGEAISWHVKEILGEKGLLNNLDVRRVTFNEITKKAVQDAFSNARELDAHCQVELFEADEPDARGVAAGLADLADPLAVDDALLRDEHDVVRRRVGERLLRGLRDGVDAVARHVRHVVDLAGEDAAAALSLSLLREAGADDPRFSAVLDRLPPAADRPQVALQDVKQPDPLLVAAVRVLEHCGWRVDLPEKHLCCGRPLYDFGMLGRARALLRQILDTLRDEIRDGTVIVGLEPSCVATFRDELVGLFPHDMDARRLSEQTFMLGEFLAEYARDADLGSLQGEAALVHGHCHHTSVLDHSANLAVLDRLGLDYDVLDSGCCGMAGSFGFNEHHYDVAQACGERVLLHLVEGPGRLVELHALVATALNAFLNPHENEGPDCLRTGVAAPDPTEQGSDEEQAKGTDNQHTREKNEILRVEGCPV